MTPPTTPAGGVTSPKVKVAGAVGLAATIITLLGEAVQESPEYDDPFKVLVVALIITASAWLKRDPRRQ